MFERQRWYPAKDGDVDGHRLYKRHYSHRPYADGRRSTLFVGPGEKSVWVTSDGLALWVWRVFIDDCPLGKVETIGDRKKPTSVNCAVFRNEGPHRSSELVEEADAIADAKWPDLARHYTYVDPAKIRSKNPGCCFRKAGWVPCGTTKSGLLCLERVRVD